MSKQFSRSTRRKAGPIRQRHESGRRHGRQRREPIAEDSDRATAKPRAFIPAQERQRSFVSRSLLNCHVWELGGIVRRIRRATAQKERDAAKSSFSPHDAADKDCGMAVERQHKFVRKHIVRCGDTGPKGADITHHTWMCPTDSTK